MTYTISILPASTQAGREAIRSLLSDPSKPTVRGFYRDPSKAPPEFASRENFHALKGDVTTGEGLRAFWAEQMPAWLVGEMVEYNLSALPGGVSAGEFAGDEHTVWGEVELVDALRRICTA